ncbi:MAG: hypothetical protein H6622_07080 [Halobacteriovoraceae bacterium]|nr:hypothetical protein [Halobacteriovoraceae bacterium]
MRIIITFYSLFSFFYTNSLFSSSKEELRIVVIGKYQKRWIHISKNNGQYVCKNETGLSRKLDNNFIQNYKEWFGRHINGQQWENNLHCRDKVTFNNTLLPKLYIENGCLNENHNSLTVNYFDSICRFTH